VSPKQAYDERKRLRIENDLRICQRTSSELDREDEFERKLDALLISFERIASVLELWADLQGESE
jgi:hypothetical protein